MATKTTRLFAEDIERAQMVAAVRRESPQQLLHVALDEFIANHRDELAGTFRQVQHAVLSGDREQLRQVFMAGVPAEVDGDMRHLERLLAENAE